MRMQSNVALVWCALSSLCAGLFSCGGEREAYEPTAEAEEAVTSSCSANVCTYAFAVSQGTSPRDVVLGATRDLRVGDRSVVRGYEATPPGYVVNVGTSFTRIGSKAQAGTIVSSAVTQLANFATVQSLYTEAVPDVQSGAKVLGELIAGLDIERDDRFDRVVTFPAQINASPNLEPGGTPAVVALAPGRYGNLEVKSGRTLSLSAGEYFFGSLTIHPQAILRIEAGEGEVVANLQGVFVLRGSMTGTVTPGLPIPSFTVLTNSTAQLDLETPFRGALIAPNAKINLRGGIHRGAFFGRDIELQSDSVVEHVDMPQVFEPFSFALSSLVTGGTVSLPDNDTDAAEQAEACGHVSKPSVGDYVVTVTYNDRTTSATNPLIEYPAGKSGDQRVVHKGVSLMGWSYSTDAGLNFAYGGRVSPPSGWSAIWGDPAIASFYIDDPRVYMGQMAATTASFESTPGYDPATETILNAAPSLSGYCVARSNDHGITFPAVGCVEDVFHDGTSLAIARNLFDEDLVFLAGRNTVTNQAGAWVGDGETLTFTKLPDPFPGQNIRKHPRLRHINGLIYIMAVTDGGSIIANTMQTFTGGGPLEPEWDGVQTIATGVSLAAPTLADGRTLRQANPFSFDIGFDYQNHPKVRLIYTFQDSGAAGLGIKSRECEVDLTGCVDGGWSTVGLAGDQYTPSIRYGEGHWGAMWWTRETAPSGSVVGVTGAELSDGPGGDVLEQELIEPAVNPCSAVSSGSVHYWGDYNEIAAFDDGRFFAPFTVNGPGCRWSGEWTADMHVGSAVFSF